MNENIYFLSDKQIISLLGEKVKLWRLQQNISQSELSVSSGVGLSSIQKIEKGEGTSLEITLKVLRALRKLDFFTEMIAEEQLSPSQYFMMQSEVKKRKRASGTRK